MTQPSPGPLADPQRLTVLARTGLMEAVADQALERLSRVAARLVEAPVALVSLVDDESQHFPAHLGLGDPWASANGTPLSHSFCQHVVIAGEPLVINDAHTDPRVAGNLAITDLDVRAYLGAPIVDGKGRTLGSFCVIDHQPRQWTDADIATVSDLAAAASAEVQLRLAAADIADADAQLSRQRQRVDLLADATTSLHASLDLEQTLQSVADTLVPRLADCCVVDLRIPGDLQHGEAVITHRDPRGAAALRAAEAVEPRRANPDSAVHQVLTGGPAAIVVADAAALRRVSHDEDGQTGRYRTVDARSVVVAPITANGLTLGALSLMRTGDAAVHYDQDDLRLAVELGRRIGIAVDNARLYARQRDTAEALQRSLLPEVPVLPGLQIAVRYLPSPYAGQVGGDWYDVLALPDGSTGLAVGDVSGHDLTAAATMGQLRAVLRSYAWNGDRPGLVLDQVCQLTRALHPGRTASLFYARLAPPEPDGSRTMLYSSAGHLPPILLRPDGEPVALGEAGAHLIGVRHTSRRTAEISVPPGATIVGFTDGLIERRGRDLDEGTALLTDLLRRCGDQDVETLADTLIRELIGDDPLDDDTAILIARLTQVAAIQTQVAAKQA